MVKQESQRRVRARLGAGQVARVLDRRAEAGRADHGAVGAGQAALGHVVPARMLEVAQQQLVHVVGAHLAAHRRGGRARRPRRPPRSRPPSPRGCGSVGQHARARRRCRPRRESDARRRRRSRSARGRSRPSAFGPVSIETQKQVPPALPQLTATMKAPSRRAR